MAHVLETTLKTFKHDVLESHLPVLVDLFATWCPPCRTLSKVIDEVAPMLAGRAKVVQVNVDNEPELAAAIGVSSVPMLVLVHNGTAVYARVGLTSAKSILEMIEEIAPTKPPATARR